MIRCRVAGTNARDQGWLHYARLLYTLAYGVLSHAHSGEPLIQPRIQIPGKLEEVRCAPSRELLWLIITETF